MKYFRLLGWCIVLTGIGVQVSAQDTAATYKVIKANTGQSYLLAQAKTGGVLYTDVYFRMGTVYELDSVSGISVMLTKIFDTRINAAIKGSKIVYHSTTDPEQLGFHFESDAADFDVVLRLIHDKIMKAKFDDESVDEAKAEVRADLDSIKQSSKARTDNKIRQYLWGKDYKKLNIYGDKANYAKINVWQFTNFHYKYFLPLNNMILVTGTFAEQDAVNKMQAAFNDFRTKEFNPEQIRRVIDFKPVVNTVQMLAKGSDTAIATITYQNPGAREERSATYCAFMLAALINDTKGKIAQTLMDSNIQSLKASYNCNNFEGTFTITVKMLTHNYNSALARVDSMIRALDKKDFFTVGELNTAGVKVAKEFSERRSHTHEYMTQVARYRFSNDENYFPSLADSIQNVTVAGMHQYVNDYFAGHAGIKCLYADIDSTVPEAQHYLPMDESISEMKFTYAQNMTDIDSVTGRGDLQKLIQWLTINPDMHVQINGFSDKSEYTKSYDTTISKFIKNTPTFRKAMPDAVKVGYLRIEMMRAMKIAKAIYEAGITEDRITGTSMVFTSDSDEAAAANRKCTVTLEKIQPRLSLYEYHFGKKKEEDMPNKQ
jgi:predicted Zn-dependent peptidase